MEDWVEILGLHLIYNVNEIFQFSFFVKIPLSNDKFPCLRFIIKNSYSQGGNVKKLP